MRNLSVIIVLLVAVPITSAQSSPQSSERDRQQAVEYLKKGQELQRAEKLDQAREAFASAVKLDPLLELAHYGLGQIAMSTRQYPEAVRAYTACRDAFLSNSTHALSDSLAVEQRIQSQVQELKDTVLVLQRGRVKTLNTDATIARLNGQISELESRRYRTPGAAPQTPPWISIALGSAYFRTNAMADAEREYRAALDVDPKLGEGHNNLAVVLMLTSRYDEADREVKAAEENGFKVNPQFKEDLRKRRGGGGR